MALTLQNPSTMPDSLARLVHFNPVKLPYHAQDPSDTFASCDSNVSGTLQYLMKNSHPECGLAQAWTSPKNPYLFGNEQARVSPTTESPISKQADRDPNLAMRIFGNSSINTNLPQHVVFTNITPSRRMKPEQSNALTDAGSTSGSSPSPKAWARAAPFSPNSSSGTYTSCGSTAPAAISEDSYCNSSDHDQGKRLAQRSRHSVDISDYRCKIRAHGSCGTAVYAAFPSRSPEEPWELHQSPTANHLWLPHEDRTVLQLPPSATPSWNAQNFRRAPGMLPSLPPYICTSNMPRPRPDRGCPGHLQTHSVPSVPSADRATPGSLAENQRSLREVMSFIQGRVERFVQKFSGVAMYPGWNDRATAELLRRGQSHVGSGVDVLSIIQSPDLQAGLVAGLIWQIARVSIFEEGILGLHSSPQALSFAEAWADECKLVRAHHPEDLDHCLQLAQCRAEIARQMVKIAGFWSEWRPETAKHITKRVIETLQSAWVPACDKEKLEKDLTEVVRLMLDLGIRLRQEAKWFELHFPQTGDLFAPESMVCSPICGMLSPLTPDLVVQVTKSPMLLQKEVVHGQLVSSIQYKAEVLASPFARRSSH